MFRKLFIGLSPLFAVAAFAVVPVAAQATGHYYSNGLKIAEGSKKTVMEWGTITWAGVKGGTLPNHMTCHHVLAGYVENPVGGGPGVGSTEVWVAYQCEQENLCPAGTTGRFTAEKIVNNATPPAVSTGWPNVISEPSVGLWRVETSRLKLDLGCFLATEPETRSGGERFVEIGGFGTETAGLLQKPEIHKGTNAGHPGGLVFGVGSGELQGEGAGEALTWKTEGEVKTLGYPNQELINVKE